MELQQLQNTKTLLTQKMQSNSIAYKAEIDIKGGLVAIAEGEYKTLKEQMAEQLNKYKELMNAKIGLDMEIATYRRLVDSETLQLERYDDAISFESLHKFYAYSSEKGDNKGKQINLTRAQWNTINKKAPVIKTNEQLYKAIDINTTKLGTNPYYSGKSVVTSDIKSTITKYESGSVKATLATDW